MQRQWSLQDAKNKFSEVVKAAQAGMPQIVTKRGLPAVVVLSAAAYGTMLEQERTNGNFASFLLTMPVGNADEQPITLQLREIDW